jgi:Tol biopolymer transport system component
MPDGKSLAYIAYTRGVANIYIQPIDGKPAHALTDFTSGDIYNFAFAADGSRLYLARGYAVTNAVLISNFK